jgi:predicted double-glycine peptidase
MTRPAKRSGRTFGLLLAGAALLAITLTASGARADSVTVEIGGGRLRVPVLSWKSRTYRTVFLQQYDFSCGSAALASLLTFHYDRPVLEDEVFAAMYRAGDQALIRRQGFSLLDMKSYLAGLGYEADGFEVTLDKMAEIGIPFITLIDTRGYKHFVVVKGIEKDRVLIGDPARGVVVYRRADFERAWERIAFLIRGHANEALGTFNDARDWSAHPRAPIGHAALSPQALASVALHTRM